MKVHLGADHNGLELKKQIETYLKNGGYEVVDEGDLRLDPDDDFPIFASRVVNAMKASDEESPKGILICGSGQGMCMAANRYKGIRAALCWNIKEARSARNDDDSNILCLSASSTSLEEAKGIINAWLNTPFAGAGRFIRRLVQLDQME